MATDGYSPQIDGLRAVAVLSVLLYHLEFSLFQGGFVGVDVFFVISGFLITRIIKDEVCKTNTFSFGNFYARRVRRLIPALLCTVAVSYLFGYLLFPLTHMKAFAESALAAVLNVSNFHFYSQADYFDALAQTKPLLNTWTLGVEMQFYLVWPILLFGLLIARRKWLPVAFVVGTIAGSTLLAEYWLSANPPAAFYLLPARAGELALGGLLVWLLPVAPRSTVVRECMALLGLSLIIGTCLLLGKESRFPGVLAMVTCAGTALVILGSQARFSGALLRHPLMVGMGRISYSVYLVHWPLIVFWKAYTYVPLTLTEKCLLLLISLALGWLQWRHIEERFRYASKGALVGWRFAAKYCCLAVMVLVPFGWAYASGGLRGRIPQERLGKSNAELRTLERQLYCRNMDPTKDATLFTCQNYRGKDADIFVWGDSHSLHLVSGLSEQFPEYNIFVAYSVGCDAPSGFDDYVRNPNTDLGEHCVERNRRLMAYFEQAPPTRIILSNAKRSTPKVIAKATSEILSALEASGHSSVVLGDFIRPGVALNDCRMAPRYFFDDATIMSRCVGDRETIDKELRYNEELAALLGDQFLEINDVQCPEGACRFFDGTTLLYRDHHHLSIDGSRLFIEEIEDRLRSSLSLPSLQNDSPDEHSTFGSLPEEAPIHRDR